MADGPHDACGVLRTRETVAESPCTGSALIERAVRALPPRLYAVLMLVEVHGLKPREAALLLGVSPAMIGTLAARARGVLRRETLALRSVDADQACGSVAPSSQA